MANFQHLSVDLLNCDVDTPVGTLETIATRLARAKFKEQLAKAAVPLSTICEARLEIEKLPGTLKGIVNGHGCDGHLVLFRAQATTDHGKTYQSERSVFVAPHNPRVELRSARGEIDMSQAGA